MNQTKQQEVSRVASRPSSPVMEAHEKTTRYLQRQSTPNSSRRYFYGDQQGAKGEKQQQAQRQRKNSTTSSSSASMSSIEELKLRRREGATSRDSGFRSPAHFRSETPIKAGGGEIYSVSRKHKSSQRGDVASPTPSAGQRSVKTTTTTMSAGLTDRPLSRADKAEQQRQQQQQQRNNNNKVSKPPSPFQKLAQMFAPSSKNTQTAKAARQQQQAMASR